MNVEFENGRPKGYLTVKEYASKMYVHPNCIRRYIKEERIQSEKIGNIRYIKENTPYPDPKIRGPEFKMIVSQDRSQNIKTFSERLQASILGAGIRVSDFAKTMDISYSAAHSYLHGRRCPNLNTTIEIARRFHLSLDWLCGLE